MQSISTMVGWMKDSIIQALNTAMSLNPPQCCLTRTLTPDEIKIIVSSATDWWPSWLMHLRQGPKWVICHSNIFLWAVWDGCLTLDRRNEPGIQQNYTARNSHELCHQMYPHIYAVNFCLTGPLFQNYSRLGYSRLGRSPEVNFWELLWQKFYRLDALPVTQTTESKHCVYIIPKSKYVLFPVPKLILSRNLTNIHP